MSIIKTIGLLAAGVSVYTLGRKVEASREKKLKPYIKNRMNSYIVKMIEEATEAGKNK